MRRRGRNPNENPGVRPVQQIELQEKNPKKRIIIAVMLLAIGLGFIGYGVHAMLNEQGGWTQIQPTSPSAQSVESELVLLYDLGASGRSPNAEHKALATRYTQLCRDAYRIFTADEAFDDVKNLYDVNRNVGEAVTVDPALYGALEKVDAAGKAGRFLFAAPFYKTYNHLLSAVDDVIAAKYDPMKSEETAARFATLAGFTADESQVSLELLGNNAVRLTVSDAYLAFAQEQGIETFVDLGWAMNAFVVDYLADTLTREGYTYGTLSSLDGFIRVLDKRDTAYSYNLYGLVDNTICNAARLDYTGGRSIVFLRSFPMTDQDSRYYVYKTGERIHPYVDVADGLCKSALDSLVAYTVPGSTTDGCAAVLLSILPVYLADTLDSASLAALSAKGVHAMYVDGTTVYHTEADARILNLYRDEEISFDKKSLPLN